MGDDFVDLTCIMVVARRGRGLNERVERHCGHAVAQWVLASNRRSCFDNKPCYAGDCCIVGGRGRTCCAGLYAACVVNSVVARRAAVAHCAVGFAARTWAAVPIWPFPSGPAGALVYDWCCLRGCFVDCGVSRAVVLPHQFCFL